MKVTVYTQTVCGPCTATKRALTKHGVDFVEVSAEDPKVADRLRGLGYSKAPVVEVIGSDDVPDYWTGFQLDQIEALGRRVADERG